MDRLRILASRFASIFRRRTQDEDLDEELRTHIDLAVEENRSRGMTAAQARTAALRSFGGVTQTREAYRVNRGLPFVEVLSRDVRYALRQLFRSPGFTITAVVTLALGIGANTAIFTLVHGILLRSLPVADPARLYRIGDAADCCYYDRFQNDDGDFDLFSYDLYLRLKQATPEFEQLAAVEAGGETFTVRWGSAAARPMRAEYVSGNYFTTLGVGAYAGRPLGASDDTPTAAPALVLSYRTWAAEFASDPGIVGSTIYVQMHPFIVAGIAPPGFFGDRIISHPPDMWMPLSSEPVIEEKNSSLMQVNTAWLYPLGRLRAGVSTAALESRLSQAVRQWMVTQPAFTANGGAAEIPKQHVVLAPGGGGIQKLQQQTGEGLRLLMILSSVVLLIACANIGNLLLARGTTRRLELSVRIALGAARSRLLGQILTESVLLSLLGGAAGLAVAYAGSHMILALAFPDARNMPVHASPSPAVLGFAFLVSLVTGIVFGSAPAWLMSHAQPAEAMRGASRPTGSARDRASLPQKSLVVLQVAMSVVLLAGAILMTRSLGNLERQNFGLATANRYVLEFDPQGAGYTVGRLPALYRAIEDRFAALPGEAHVSLARYIPLGGNNWGACVIPQGKPAPGPNDKCWATWDRVSTQFFDSIGVPVLRGRGFAAQDTSPTQPVVLVNQAFARRFFPGQDPIGKRFRADDAQAAFTYEIVGEFADFKMTNPRKEVEPAFFRPMAQQYMGYTKPDLIAAEMASMFMRFAIVDFSRPQTDAEAGLRRTMAAIDPGLTVFRLVRYDAEVAGNFNQDRLLARLTGLFGVLALILASVGLYGVMSYFVARRSGEIGIRMALGATRSNVVNLVLRGALGQVLAGLALGIPAALVAGRFMSALLFGVSAYDPAALIGATLALAACAAAAGFIPARRAASTDPMQALRTE